jgi:hypothetical protein
MCERIRAGWLAHPFAAMTDFAEPAEKAVADTAIGLRFAPTDKSSMET